MLDIVTTSRYSNTSVKFPLFDSFQTNTDTTPALKSLKAENRDILICFIYCDWIDVEPTYQRRHHSTLKSNCWGYLLQRGLLYQGPIFCPNL